MENTNDNYVRCGYGEHFNSKGMRIGPCTCPKAATEAAAPAAGTGTKVPPPFTLTASELLPHIRVVPLPHVEDYGEAKAEEARREAADVLAVTNRQLTNALAQIEKLETAQRTAGGEAVDLILRDVAELDYAGFEDNLMVVTPDDLRLIINRHIGAPVEEAAAQADGERLYRFDTFDARGVKLAGGIAVHASSMAAAEEKARGMIERGEARIKFRDNEPCHRARKCAVCARQSAAAPTAQPTPKRKRPTLEDQGAGMKLAHVATNAAASSVAQPTTPDDERAAAVLLKLCDQLEAMKRTMFLRPGTGQHYSYIVHEDMAAYVEQARAALRHPPVPNVGEKLRKVIAHAYQIAGAHDVPAHILDVLSDPDAASDAQIDAMLPYVPPAQPTQAGAEPAAAATIDTAALDGLQHAATALADAQQHIASSRDACWEHERGQWDHYQKGIDAIADLRARLASAGAGEKGGA